MEVGWGVRVEEEEMVEERGLEVVVMEQEGEGEERGLKVVSE